jgi:hypothetical protein
MYNKGDVAIITLCAVSFSNRVHLSSKSVWSNKILWVFIWIVSFSIKFLGNSIIIFFLPLFQSFWIKRSVLTLSFIFLCLGNKHTCSYFKFPYYFLTISPSKNFNISNAQACCTFYLFTLAKLIIYSIFS